MKMKLSLLAASAILAVGMTGCWTENAPTAAEVAVVAKALDGYILNANGCVDANNNDACDVGEYTFKTNGTDGGYTIPAANNTGKVIITGGTDKDTGLAFTGVLKAPKGSTMATPLTTLLADGMDATLIASLFGISVADLSKDYRAVVEAGGAFSATDAKLSTAALQVQAILTQITALVSAAGTTKSPAEIMKVAVTALKANTTTTTTLTGTTALDLTSVMTAVTAAIPTTNTISVTTAANSLATSIAATPVITTTTTLTEVKAATATVVSNTTIAVQSLALTKAVTLTANNFTIGATATLHQDGTFNDQTVSTANDVVLQFALTNIGGELNTTAKTINLAIDIKDVVGNRELKAILQGATVTSDGTTSTINVPANAVLYVEGKDSTGSTTPILVQLTNEAANIYTAPNTFNLSNIMRQIEGKVSSTSPFANITKEGTYNISFLIGGVTLGYYVDNTAAKALSAPVSTINVLTTTSTKSTFGTTFTGKLTVTK
ncbi:MAG: hypothetical protein WCW84_09895 [Sulfurimonas sp.]|jgi:hypothetical protein